MMRFGAVALTVLSISGCGGYITKTGDSFEGLGDYGYVSPGSSTIEEKYREGSGGALTKGDYVSVSLKSGYISYFPESGLKKGLNWIAGSPVRGEIVILIDVVANGLSGKETLKSGRVVFYSDDVYQGQMLNISFIPVYGPVEYEGHPLGLSVRMLELDNSDNLQVKSVMDAIASVGAAATTAGSPLLINSLKDIGDALVKSNVDDKFGAFDAMFLGSGEDFGSTAPELKIGDYVLIRKADRSSGVNWNKYCYNAKRGVLQVREEGAAASTSCSTVNQQPDFSYLVLSVSRNIGINDMTPALEIQTFLNELKSAETPKQMQAAAGLAVREVVRKTTMSKVRKALAVLAAKETPAVSRSINAQVVADSLQCSSLARVDFADPSTELTVTKRLCGDYFLNGSISTDDYQYVANRLSAMGNCLKPVEITPALFYDQLNTADLEAKRATLTSKISSCGT